MSDQVDRENREHSRGFVPLAATVLRDGSKGAQYLVRNLSAGGALLLQGPRIAVGTRVRVLLEGPVIGAQYLSATVVRCGSVLEGVVALAIRFNSLSAELEDLLQRVVLEALERQRQPAVLVALPRPELFTILADQLHAAGRRVILAVTALDAIRSLSELDASIEAVLVERVHDLGFDQVLLEFLHDEFPSVRRVVIDDQAGSQAESALRRGLAHAVLGPGWTRTELELSLGGDERGTHGSQQPSAC